MSDENNTNETNETNEASPEEAAAVLDALGPPPEQPDAAAAPTKVLETVLMRFLARVIHADGEIHPKEMTTLIEIAMQMGLGGTEARKILDDEFEKKSDVAVLASQIPDEQMRKEALAMGCVMSCADGEAADSERNVLVEFGKGAGIDEETTLGILGKLTEAMEKARADASG